MTLINPGSAIVNKIKQKKETPYQLDITPKVNRQDIEKFKQEFADIESFTHKKYSDIANGAKEATNSLEDYYAQTIKLNQEATFEGYNDFLNEKLLERLGTKEGREKIFEESNQLAKNTDKAKEKFEELNTQLQDGESRLQAMRAQLEVITSLNNEEDTDSEGDGASWIETLTGDIDIEAENVESLRTRLDEARETLTQCNQDQAAYNATIANSDSTMAQYLQTVGQGTATTKGYIKYLVKMKAKAIGTQIVMSALNAAMTFMASVAIQAAITGIMALAKHYDNLREANMEAADSFKETSDSIQGQIDKIKELQKVVEDETSTSNELYDARSDLLDIQRDIINTYGEQAKGIDLVNGKLEEEIKDLDELERLEAAKAFHKMSKDSYEHDKRSLEETHNGSGSNDTYGVGISLSAFADDSQFKKQAEDLEKKILSLGYQYVGDEASTKAYTLTQVTDEEAIEKINELMSYIETNISTSSDIYNLRDNLAKKLERLDTEDFQNKKSNVEAYALQNILSSEKYRPLYKGLQAAAADYDEAIKSGDEALAKSSIKRINEQQGKIANLNIDDEYIKKQFSSTLEQIQKDLNKNELKVYIETAPKYTYSPVFGISENGARGGYSPLEYFKNAFEGYSDIDVENIGVSGGSEKEVKAYNMLEKAANYYGMKVEDVIDVLVELGIIFSRDADAAKYTTTNFASMLEEVEKTTEGLDKFVSAQGKLMSGTSLTADEVNELIKLDGSLASSVERTANGYVISSEKLAEARAKYINEQKESLKEDIAASEKQLENVKRELAVNQKIVDELGSKSDLTDDEKRKLNDAKVRVENRLEAEKATTEQLEQQKLLLEQILTPVTDYAEKFNQVADKAKSVTEKITQMKANQAKTGALNPEDVLDFINEVPDWQKYIDIKNGKASVKNTANDALIEQIKESSGYYAVEEDLKQTIKDRDDKIKEIADFKKNNPISSASDAKMLEDMNHELKLMNDIVDVSQTEFEELTKILEVFFKLLQKKPAITNFEKDLEELNHNKSMGMSEDAYADRYKEIANNYLKDLEALAAEGNTDALSKVWEIKEQLYQNGIDTTQRAFDAKKLIIDNAREDLQMSVLEYRDAYAALNEDYYAPGTDLGNTEDGKKQYAANLREIEKLSSEAYDNITSRFQSAIDFGKIIDPNIINDLADVFKGQELPDAVAQVIQKGIETGIWDATDLATIAPYLTEALLAGSDVNSEAYQNAINQQKDYIISAFEYEKTQLDNQLEAGLISSGDFIDEYTKLWEKYYKDKKEFAEEDLQTQKDILEAHKSEIQKQIDALEAYSENQTEPYQNEIDALNDVKDAYDDMIDDRIDALEEEKKAIEKKNEKQEEANDLQEKWLNLQKASMNKRLVYMGNGGWQLKRDEEEYNNAKKEYDEAKKEDATAKIDEAIEKLEEEKEARDKAIDKDIEAREDAIKRIQKPIDDLTKVLTLLVTEQQNIDPEFIAQLLNTESADEALALINKKNSFGQEQEAKYGVDANYDQLTTETINKLAKEAEKRNQTLDEYAKSLGLNLSETVTNANQNTIDKLLDEYNKLVSDRKSKGSDYGEVGHTGKVDYNNRPINLNEDDYNTLLGTTLSYESIANMFDEYLNGNNIESEELWNICKALWKIVETNENMHFNVSPLRPDGTAITNLNGNDDQFFGGIYDYILSQLTNGIRLEDMDIFMGGNYASGEIADKAAQEAHNDSAKMYDQEAEILRQLIALGYDVNQLDGVKYTGEIPTQPETQDNTKSTDANTDAIKENTEAVEKAAATTADTTADATETNKNVDASGYLIDSNGKQVLNDGKPIKALTHDEWAKKHKVSEWATPGRSVNENMTMEQYETLKKGQKNGIIPASIVDIADITDAQLKQFLGAIQSNTKIAPQNVNTAMKPIADIANEAIQTYNSSPIINFSVQVDGSADEKTIQAMETKIGNMLISYTDKLTSSIATSSLRRQNKS